MKLAGRILTPGGWVAGSLEADARVTAIREGAGGDALLLPGFVDLHVHGGGGADVLDGPEGVQQTAAFHVVSVRVSLALFASGRCGAYRATVCVQPAAV